MDVILGGLLAIVLVALCLGAGRAAQSVVQRLLEDEEDHDHDCRD